MFDRLQLAVWDLLQLVLASLTLILYVFRLPLGMGLGGGRFGGFGRGEGWDSEDERCGKQGGG